MHFTGTREAKYGSALLRQLSNIPLSPHRRWGDLLAEAGRDLPNVAVNKDVRMGLLSKSRESERGIQTQKFQ
jgi:hypothetical protein